MVEGAIIGGVIGGVAGLATSLKNSRWQRAFMAKIAANQIDAARSLLFKRAKEVPPGNFPMRSLLDQRSRIAAFAILGDTEALERELTRHTGGVAYKGQVVIFNQLALALRGDDPTHWVAALRAMAEEIARESNPMQKRLVNQAAGISRVAGGLIGEAINQDDELALLKATRDAPLLVQITHYRLLEQIAELQGRPNTKYRQQLPALSGWRSLL